MQEKIDELKIILNIVDINILNLQLSKLFNTCGIIIIKLSFLFYFRSHKRRTNYL